MRPCPACAGAGPSARDECKVCGGTAVVSDATWERWNYRGRTTASSSTMPIVANLEGIVRHLKAQGTAEAYSLAVRGRRLLDEIDDWQVSPVDGAKRAETYGRASTWLREALDELKTRDS